MKDTTNVDAITIQAIAIIMLFFIYGGVLYLIEQHVGFWVGTVFAFITIVMLKNSIKEVIKWKQRK